MPTFEKLIVILVGVFVFLAMVVSFFANQAFQAGYEKGYRELESQIPRLAWAEDCNDWWQTPEEALKVSEGCKSSKVVRSDFQIFSRNEPLNEVCRVSSGDPVSEKSIYYLVTEARNFRPCDVVDRMNTVVVFEGEMIPFN